MISVIMPVHNGENFIENAIQSILLQTYKNFELIIIDDGSTDMTKEIVLNIKDRRVRILSNKLKMGLVKTRERGILNAKGEFIAFLDSDDLSIPKRLEVQQKFLTDHPEIGLVGSWVKVINADGKKIGKTWKHVTSPDLIPGFLLFRNCFTQSTIMMRRAVIERYIFRKEFTIAPDYDLWVRIAQQYKIANIPEALSFYRIHDSNISQLPSSNVREETGEIYKYQLSQLDIVPTVKELTIHRSLEETNLNHKYNLEELTEWLSKIVQANIDLKKYNQKNLEFIVSQYLFKIFCMHAQRGVRMFRQFINTTREHHLPVFITQKLVLFSLCLMKKNYEIDVSAQPWIKLMI